jgi:RNA polymerase sigma factor (sigma-70 family)
LQTHLQQEMTESLKPLLTTYAYNILGTLQDAEDVVQDVYLKYHLLNKEEINDEKAYLTRMVINQSINLKKKLQKTIAEYPGKWLPEPVSTELADTNIERKEILSYSLMVLLEKLNPRQRGVFILKEAFDYEHEEIADVLGISVDNSRQLLNRAKKQLQREQLPADSTRNNENLDKYLAVIRSGDVAKLEQLLAEEIGVTSDGGGKAAAFKPMSGRKNVTALLSGIYRKFYSATRIEKTEINGEPALLYYDNGQLVNCQVLVFEDSALKNIYFMRNPDKLKRLEKSFS